MKKYVIIAIIACFILTGCGAGATETMSCNYETTINNLTTKMTYNIDYQDEEVKKLRVTYKYHSDDDNTNLAEENDDTDGIGTGTDGTTNDNPNDSDDGIIDGVVGSAIDNIINGVSTTIIDIAGLRDRHATVQNTYGNMAGFSVQNTNDVNDNDYTVTYVIDYDTINDDDLSALSLSRNINTLRSNYIQQGFTCK